MMGLNLSNQQIAQELDLDSDDAQEMTAKLRTEIVVKQKSYEPMVEKGGVADLKRAQGRGTLAKEKPPILGMIQRQGEVVIQMLANVKQATIAPLIKSTITSSSLVYTKEYKIYARLTAWGYQLYWSAFSPRSLESILSEQSYLSRKGP